MAVQTVTLREQTDIGVEERVVETTSTQFFVNIGGKKFSPAVTTNIELENDGDIADPQDQCGNVERTKVSNKGYNIRIEGIATMNQEREGNLSMQLIRDYVGGADDVDIRCDLFEGTIVVSNIVITQSSDLVSIQTVDTEGEEKAVEFQLQLGEKETDD